MPTNDVPDVREARDIAEWTLARLRTGGVRLPDGITVLVGSLRPWPSFRARAIWLPRRRLIAVDLERTIGLTTGRRAREAIVEVVLHEAAHAIARPDRSPHGRGFLAAARRVAPLLDCEPPESVAVCRRWPALPAWAVS
jgi:hypothetical protein